MHHGKSVMVKYGDREEDYMIREIDIKIGKTYPIKYLIEELKKHTDIKLGHIYVLNKHEYRLGLAELEELQKRIIKAERDNIGSYDLSGKRKANVSDVTLLSIIDPYSKYEKYEKFYKEFYDQIEKGIETSEFNVVMASIVEILEEARKEGFAIEKDDDLLDGISIYFERKGIDSRRVMKEKEGVRKEYIVFGRSGTIVTTTKEEKVEKKPEKGKLISIIGRDAQIIKEQTKEFEPFYSDLEQTVLAFIKQSKDKSAAIKIDNIVEEAKKTISDADIKKDIMLKGMTLFFIEKGINADIKKDDKGFSHMIFEMT